MSFKTNIPSSIKTMIKFCDTFASITGCMVTKEEDKMMKILTKTRLIKLVSYIAVICSIEFLIHQSYVLYVIKTFNAGNLRLGVCDECRYNEHMVFVIVPNNIATTDKITEYSVINNPKIIITVCSKVSNLHRRNMIRATWGSRTEQMKHNFRLIFLLGIDHVSSDEMVILENNKHGDIVQASVIETYKNLTRKTLHAFQWVMDSYSEAEYFFKVDDDVFIHISNLMIALNNYNLTNSVAGDCSFHSQPFRDRSHKWYISYEQYPYPF